MLPYMDHHSDDTSRPRGLRRREALGLLGGAGLTGALGAGAALRGGAPASSAAAQTTCVLTPEVTEGPYWIDTNLTRRDIREGRPGLPLLAVFTVQNARTCEPIPGADVEIWHCDAAGEYSGFDSAGEGGAPPAGPPEGGGGPGGGTPTSDTRYLRGHQRADANGRARFLTVFPGWYTGRTPHIHLKVHVGGEVVHTGQVFFDERITRAVYRRAPYRGRGQYDTSHAEDSIFAQAGRSRAVLRLTRRGGGRAGYRGAITLAVAT
jgi:protocatechuate 3,4-dioxygenase beta subunit